MPVRLLLQVAADERAVADWASRLGWVMREDVPQDGRAPARRTWTASSGTGVTYVLDAWHGMHFLEGVGPDGSGALALAASALPAWSREELLNVWDDAVDQDDVHVLEAATCALGVVAEPPLDMDVPQRIAKSLLHRSPRVRYLALRAAELAGQAELAPALLHVADTDPAPDVREHAGRVAAALEAADRVPDAPGA